MAEGRPVTLTKLLAEAEQTALWRQIEAIFFEAARRQDFPSTAERDAFCDRWLGYYRAESADHIYLALDGDGAVAGYLTGCLDSTAATRLFEDLPHYHLFADRFTAFPAHLHVNCRFGHRGQGLGSRLVETFCADCKERGIAGVHVVTAAEARNAAFYRRLAFSAELIRPWRDRDLLFLGRELD